MQRLGRVLHMSSSRNLILRADTRPRIGDKVVDQNLQFVGAIFDIFGPVSFPYIAIKPAISNPDRLIENTLYTIPSSGRRKEKIKHGR